MVLYVYIMFVLSYQTLLKSNRLVQFDSEVLNKETKQHIIYSLKSYSQVK